jgi:hypothetical protein
MSNLQRAVGPISGMQPGHESRCSRAPLPAPSCKWCWSTQDSNMVHHGYRILGMPSRQQACRWQLRTADLVEQASRLPACQTRGHLAQAQARRVWRCNLQGIKALLQHPAVVMRTSVATQCSAVATVAAACLLLCACSSSSSSIRTDAMQGSRRGSDTHTDHSSGPVPASALLMFVADGV